MVPGVGSLAWGRVRVGMGQPVGLQQAGLSTPAWGGGLSTVDPALGQAFVDVSWQVWVWLNAHCNSARWKLVFSL